MLLSQTKPPTVGRHNSVEIRFSVTAVTMKSSAVSGSAGNSGFLLTRQSGLSVLSERLGFPLWKLNGALKTD